jgi:transposase
MSFRRYQKSLNRQQEMLLPSRVEDYMSDKNTVRAIETYVDTLNLKSLKYTHTQESSIAGQPAYDPAGLLKLYIYGYMHGIRSSRKLEREAHRNLEVIWLIEGQLPSYKTIANFRKNNSQALKSSNRDFVMLCKELNLLGCEVVAVDGSFFKANARKDSIYTESRLNKELDALEKKITAYQNALDQQDEIDDKEGVNSLVEDPQLTEKLEKLKARQTEK